MPRPKTPFLADSSNEQVPVQLDRTIDNTIRIIRRDVERLISAVDSDELTPIQAKKLHGHIDKLLAIRKECRAANADRDGDDADEELTQDEMELVKQIQKLQRGGPFSS